VTTDDFVTISSNEAKLDLRWFFEVYVRRAKLPALKAEASNGTLKLEWTTPDDLPFPMPVDVAVAGRTVRVPMPGGKGSVAYSGSEPVVDPNGWVLKQ
jgi:aminopeptidase N